MHNPIIATVVYPAHDFTASIEAWSTVFGTGPAYSSAVVKRSPGEPDFALFKTPDIEIGLSSLPWLNEPLVMLDTADIAASRQDLIDAGAKGLGEAADGSLVPPGTAHVIRGDPETGIVDVPGARLAVVELADGSRLGLRQSVPISWGP